MPDLLTTDEAAAYLRLSERKLYELVANGAVPCSKVTGKWLFPRAALDRWLVAGLVLPALAQAPAPPILIRTWPGPGSGTGTSRSSAGFCAATNWNACMGVPSSL